MKKKRSKAWIWIVVAAVVLLAAGYLLNRAARLRQLNANTQQYEAVTVTRGDIDVTVHGTGSLEAMDVKTVTAAASGKVDSVLVENGDTVKQGDVIAQLNADADNDQIQSLKEQITQQDATIAEMRAAPTMAFIYAPVDCRVKAIYAEKGDDVNASMSADGALMLLSTDGCMKVDFTPAQGASVSAGQPVKITSGGKTESGYIRSVPDGTTDQAEAVVAYDRFDLDADATVADANGTQLGSGKLEVNKPLLVTADSGKVDYIYVKDNEKLYKGHKLFRLNGAVLDPNFSAALEQRQQLQDNLNKAYNDLADLSIKAPCDGVVTDLALQQGGMAQEGMQVCTVHENDGFKLVVAVDELDIPGIKPGQTASVQIDALPDAEATGEVTKIDPVGNKANDVTTYDVTLKVNAPDGALSGMSASADIETASKTGALLVPVEAIHTVDGKNWVYMALPGDPNPSASPEATSRPGLFGNRAARNSNAVRQQVEVTVGLVSDTYAEIVSGLNEGDQVAIQDTTTSSSASGMFGFGAVRNQGSQTTANPSGSGG